MRVIRCVQDPEGLPLGLHDRVDDLIGTPFHAHLPAVTERDLRVAV